ncbi:MAG: 50S ribosomal protein L19e, partial [Nitrosotalea sp.]
MVVNLRTKRQLVSRILGVGVDRVKFDPTYLDDVADAITRDNIRSLITANVIEIRPIKGTSKGRAHFKKAQRKKRGTKHGSRKGSKGA